MRSEFTLVELVGCEDVEARSHEALALLVVHDKDTYIRYLKSKDISYKDILEILTEDKDFIISESTKDKIVKLLLSDR